VVSRSTTIGAGFPYWILSVLIIDHLERIRNGYWYADDLKKFAEKIGVPLATRLRKDELERAVKHFLRTGDARSFDKRALTKFGPRDVGEEAVRRILGVLNLTKKYGVASTDEACTTFRRGSSCNAPSDAHSETRRSR
jgi:hypothetical protein